MVVDETLLELLVVESIREATLVTKNAISRRNSKPNSKPYTYAESIGIFVTCLRTELGNRAGNELHKLPINLHEEFLSSKSFLCNTENWIDIGVLRSDGQRNSVWKTTSSGRSKLVKLYEAPMDKDRITQLVGITKTDDFNFDASFSSMDKLIRDMKLMAAQHESLTLRACQITESLCTVAESLVEPVYETV